MAHPGVGPGGQEREGTTKGAQTTAHGHPSSLCWEVQDLWVLFTGPRLTHLWDLEENGAERGWGSPEVHSREGPGLAISKGSCPLLAASLQTEAWGLSAGGRG